MTVLTPIDGVTGNITLAPANVPVPASAGYQEVDVGGARVGGDSTGLTNDGTSYFIFIFVDGGGSQFFAVTGSDAQTYTTLIADMNSNTTGAVWSLTNGNLRATSDSTGASSTINIVDNTLLLSLTDFVAINTAVIGTAATTADGGTVIAQTTAPVVTDDTLFNVAGDLQWQDGEIVVIEADGAIVIPDTTAPSPTTNKLYSVSGVITWNGSDITKGEFRQHASGTLYSDVFTGSGVDNFLAGDGAGNRLTSVTGRQNTFIGKNAGTAVTTGQQNIAIGLSAMNSLDSVTVAVILLSALARWRVVVVISRLRATILL